MIKVLISLFPSIITVAVSMAFAQANTAICACYQMMANNYTFINPYGAIVARQCISQITVNLLLHKITSCEYKRTRYTKGHSNAYKLRIILALHISVLITKSFKSSTKLKFLLY